MKLLLVVIISFAAVSAEKGQAQTPNLTKVYPQSGAPGSTVSLYGTGFDATAANNTVTFTPVYGGTGTNAMPSDLTGGKLTVTVPASLIGGNYRVSVTRASDGATGALAPIFTTLSSGGGSFNDIAPGLTGVIESSSAWGDYDGDGDLDLVVTGYEAASGTPLSTIYENDSGSFSAVGAGLTGFRNGSSKWGDYDSDGDLDLILTGTNSSNTATSVIYRNNGGGTFTNISAGLTGVSNSSTDWGDYDGDGDLDLIITGYDDFSNAVTTLYKNDGTGGFTALNHMGIFAVQDGSATWGDYDNDGDLDLLIAGEELSGGFSGDQPVKVSKIYRNNGDDTFTDIGAGLTGVKFSSGDWGDFNNDGDLDLIVTGYDATFNQIATIYRNDGGGTFTDIGAGLTGVLMGSSEWGDYDGDGDLDLVITGEDASTNPIATLYHNNNGNFSTIGASLTGVRNGTANWGDYNGDGNLDLVLTGEDNAGNGNATIIQNLTSLQFTGMDPESGSPGTEVTLNGAGFGSSPSDLTVTFTPSGGGTGTDVTPTSITGGGTQLTADVPVSLTAGDYDVSITREIDNTTKMQSSAFTVLPIYIVTNTNDSGSGSLRDAIDQANGDGIESTIEFNISGTTPHTITLDTPLPVITDSVTIDGISEPDYIDSPVIELDGINTSSSSKGLRANNTSHLVFRGLAIVNFDIGIHIYDANSDHEQVTIENNYLGLKADGTSLAGNRLGISIREFENATIKNNVISGNEEDGISATGWDRANDRLVALTITGNKIGTDASGTAAKGNSINGIKIVVPPHRVTSSTTRFREMRDQEFG